MPISRISPRRIACLAPWRDGAHAAKVYGVHGDPDRTGPILSETATASARGYLEDALPAGRY